MRNLSEPAIAFAKSLTLIVIVTVAVSPKEPVFAHDRMILGPRQFEKDKGAGAVLCAWGIYLAVQAETATCGLARRPADEAIDEAIIAMDEFILANSSLHPSRAMLEDFKRRAAEDSVTAARRRGLQKICAGRDLEHFRSRRPEQIRAWTKALLAVPREPVMNPCL